MEKNLNQYGRLNNMRNTLITLCFISLSLFKAGELSAQKLPFDTSNRAPLVQNKSVEFMSNASDVSFFQVTKDDFTCGNNASEFKYICKGVIKAVLGVVEFSNQTIAISLYREDGGIPEIDQVISDDIDGDSENELIVRGKWFIWHSSENIKGYEYQVYAYDNVIDKSAKKMSGLPRLKEIDLDIPSGFDGMWDGENSIYLYKTKKSILDKIKLSQSPEIYSQKLNRQGEKQYKGKHYQAAIKTFEKAVKTDPLNLQAYSNLSLVYQKIKDYKSSISAGKKVISLSKDSNLLAATYYNIAKSYEHLHNWNEALKSYEKAKSYKLHSAYDKGIQRMKKRRDTQTL